MIKILAPSRNYEMTKMQIDAGADEIYIGVDAGDFNVYSFGGRFKSMNRVKTQLDDYEDLKKCVEICRENNILLQLTANMHYIPRELEDAYIEHIKNCAICGVDQFIVSNVGLIRKIRKSGVNTPITAGSFTFIPNSESVKFLKSLGVLRVVLPHAATLKEIETIHKKVPDVQLEIFALIGGGNNCGRCMMFHSPVREDIGPGCRARYTFYYKDQVHENVDFMDAAADCSLCSMKELMEAGVESLKIVGRETKNEVAAAMFTEIFCRYRDGMATGMSVSEIKEDLAQNEFGWNMVWIPRFCNEQKCKFHDTKVVRSYI